MKFSLNWFRSIFPSFLMNPRKEPSLILATQSDAEFIFDQVIESAKHGHFNPILVLPESHQGLTYQIATSINEKWCYVSQNEKRESVILVKQLEGKTVGFSWITKNEKNEHEIYLLSVNKSYRKQGVGSEMLADSLDFIPEGATVTARLYPVSKVMAEMMRKIGFSLSKSKAKDTILLRLKKCGQGT